MTKIAVVVPTIRPESLMTFLEQWEELFNKHGVDLFVVHDGEDQRLEVLRDGLEIIRNKPNRPSLGWSISPKNLLGTDSDLICQFNSSCRNLGLLGVAKYAPDTEVILTLDDDCYPIEGTDPIQDHLNILGKRMSVSWETTMSRKPRGFPYSVMEESKVKVSHGVWTNVVDWDAISTLAIGSRKPSVEFPVGPIPKGIYAPLCGMNIAFSSDVLPYAYWAPTADFPGAERFDDIWMGIHLARACWKNNWAIYTGASVIWHDRASNVWDNLHREHVGLELNETYWREDFEPPEQYQDWFESYDRKRERWQGLISKLLKKDTR